MAHNIWGSRFYGHRQPAWHGLGIVNEEQWSAAETFTALGEYSVSLEPLKFQLGEQVYSSDYAHVVRHPTSDDPKFRIFGAPVSKEYDLITPQQAVAMWDKHVTARIETMAVLGHGQNLFMTCVMPTFAVKGEDEVRSYLLFNNPMQPGKGVGAYVTNIRTVCENTLRAGIDGAAERYTVSHTSGAAERLAKWLEQRYQVGLTTIEVIKEAYEALANKPVTVPQVRWIAESIYREPAKPDFHKPRKTAWEDVVREYEYLVERTRIYRDTVVDLYEGQGRGLAVSVTAGNAWGAYNAFAELETYRRSNSQESVVNNLVAGDRGNNILKAYGMLMSV